MQTEIKTETKLRRFISATFDWRWQARQARCTFDPSLHLPPLLPYDDDDVYCSLQERSRLEVVGGQTFVINLTQLRMI